MKTGKWEINYRLEDMPACSEDLSEATLDHIAELIKVGYSNGEIIEEMDLAYGTLDDGTPEQNG